MPLAPIGELAWGLEEQEMPEINGRYYMNPQYGKAVERERVADEEHRRVHGEPQPSWHDYHYGFAEKPVALSQGPQQGTTHDNKSGKLAEKTNKADRTERGAMSYSEKTNGSVAEHEAMQSTVMNREASGQKQYVGKGNSVNEYNVIHAPNQYQGVLKRQFPEYMHGEAKNQGAKNAAIADANLKRTGKPTNDATFFIVNPGGKAPSDKQVHGLGNVVPAGKVGDVYLYKPKSAGGKP